MRFSGIKFGKSFALPMLLAVLLSVPAFADETAEVNLLLNAGKAVDALNRANVFLIQHPKDVQMRFLKGLILTRQNKAAEAIAVFNELTEEFPDLPEPYNNLAVLYASTGQYDKARIALDMAIHNNPTYATAHENLGDIYTKMASQAYEKSLQLDSSSANARLKLSLVRTVVSNIAGGTAPASATPAAPSGNVAMASTTPIATPTAVVTYQPAVLVKKPETDIQARPDTGSNSERDDIINTINKWAKAWSEKNVSAYLAFYASDFSTPNGESRRTWEKMRRKRIDRRGNIEVAVNAPEVTLNNNTANVKFRQVYTSKNLKEDSWKTLIMTKNNGKWYIQQELSTQ
jgi:tetratricopeptide (TPR) repeat protein